MLYTMIFLFHLPTNWFNEFQHGRMLDFDDPRPGALKTEDNVTKILNFNFK